jgi:hypothetical protein
MTTRRPRYSKEEHAQRATQLYEQKVLPQVEAGNHGKIVAIDVDSGDFEVGEDVLTTTDRLLTRWPDAQIMCFRIGYRGVHRFGGHMNTKAIQ